MKSQCVLFYLPMESPLNGREYFPMNSPIFSWWFSETIIKSSKFQILLINSIRIGFVGKILTGNHRFPHYSIMGLSGLKFSQQNQSIDQCPPCFHPKTSCYRHRDDRNNGNWGRFSSSPWRVAQHHERRAELMGWTMGWSKKNRISSAFHSFLVLFQ